VDALSAAQRVANEDMQRVILSKDEAISELKELHEQDEVYYSVLNV
jgi:hypothetical protein